MGVFPRRWAMCSWIQRMEGFVPPPPTPISSARADGAMQPLICSPGRGHPRRRVRPAGRGPPGAACRHRQAPRRPCLRDDLPGPRPPDHAVGPGDSTRALTQPWTLPRQPTFDALLTHPVPHTQRCRWIFLFSPANQLRPEVFSVVWQGCLLGCNFRLRWCWFFRSSYHIFLRNRLIICWRLLALHRGVDVARAQ